MNQQLPIENQFISTLADHQFNEYITLHKRFNTLLHIITHHQHPLPAMITSAVTMEHLHYLT